MHAQLFWSGGIAARRRGHGERPVLSTHSGLGSIADGATGHRVTIIASQAVITGAFSVASQAAQLGYLPRLRILHTSASRIGQIYVPWINWLLMVAVLTLVFAFRSSAALSYAYGMAVMGTITITTLLFLYVARRRWRTPLWIVVIGGGALLFVDLMFVAANLTKVGRGCRC